MGNLDSFSFSSMCCKSGCGKPAEAGAIIRHGVHLATVTSCAGHTEDLVADVFPNFVEPVWFNGTTWELAAGDGYPYPGDLSRVANDSHSRRWN